MLSCGRVPGPVLSIASVRVDCLDSRLKLPILKGIKSTLSEIRFSMSCLNFLIPRVGVLCAVAIGGSGGAAADTRCAPQDFLAISLSQHAPAAPAHLRALHIAYPDLLFSQEGDAITRDGQTWIDIGRNRTGITPQARLADPSLMEHFTYLYPLAFSLEERRTPFHDPGRLRHDPFFEMLYFDTEEEVRQNLVRVSFDGFSSAGVQVTRTRGVACQLTAVLQALRPHADELAPFFETPGGGFNWRTISGTTRRSAHSYGIAVDINPALGGYWKWAGVAEGQASHFNSKVPERLVTAFERYGFIWGGKWHHYDGMHFEYRPELIIYARIMSGNGD